LGPEETYNSSPQGHCHLNDESAGKSVAST